MSDCDFADDAAQTERTRETILRYHLSWKNRDLPAVLALYHPDLEYNDFYQQRCMGRAEMPDYLEHNLPHRPGELLEHVDRIRIDGHTAFIQYRTRVLGGDGLVSFRSGEAITVRDGLIWRINEYATLVHETGRGGNGPAQRPASSRLGLSVRQLGQMAGDLQEYFQRQQPFLDPQLSLQQVAAATGYSRNQISHLLNQVLGQSFYRYVNQARLNYLLDHLPDTGDGQRIDALAFSAGFNSLSAFYKCFREQLGMTPRAWLHERSLRARAQDNRAASD